MATTTAHRPTSNHPSRRAERYADARRRTMRRRLLVPGLLVLALAAAAVLAARVDSPGGTELSGSAPGFELASTDGSTVSLEEYRGRDLLLYFSEGVGCDACFYQQQKIEAEQQRFIDAGLTVVPIVVNPVEQVKRELDRFGLTTPFLSDTDKAVAVSYDALGGGHHADLPGHSFVLVDRNGQERWRLDEPSMFVEPAVLIDGATKALGR